jgi:mannitol-1-phosphate/altronate dehydrogenase
VNRVFTGFGFGPIQAGLFVREVAKSGKFKRIVIGEINQTLIDAVRRFEGNYVINIAEKDGIRTETIKGVELYNPSLPSEREKLIESVSVSTEIATCLPAVTAYKTGGISSVAAILEAGLNKRSGGGTLIYTAENNIHAAEILRSALSTTKTNKASKLQFLNTVIGKMSRVVSGPDEMRKLGLSPVVPGYSNAFLLEAFNHILADRSTLRDFSPGIPSFVEKDKLLPFEEAKLYGHLAIHAMLAYLGGYKGLKSMTRVCENRVLMEIARDAFIHESGRALCKKYASLHDPLFTTQGFSAYATDLLERMANPFLGDTVERAGRDIKRKLGPGDRLFGTIACAAQQGVQAPNMALGTLAAIALLTRQGEQHQLPRQLCRKNLKAMDTDFLQQLISWLWRDTGQLPSQELLHGLMKAKEKLIQF